MGLGSHREDVSTGRWAVRFNGAVANLATLVDATPFKGTYPRRIIFDAGGGTVVLMNGSTTCVIPDYGPGFQFDCSVYGIASGAGVAVW